MAKNELRINRQELYDMSSRLSEVASMLRNLQQWQNGLAADIEQEEIAEQLNGFERDWRKGRATIASNIEGVAYGYHRIGEQLEKLDMTIAFEVQSASEAIHKIAADFQAGK